MDVDIKLDAEYEHGHHCHCKSVHNQKLRMKACVCTSAADVYAVTMALCTHVHGRCKICSPGCCHITGISMITTSTTALTSSLNYTLVYPNH